MKGTGLGTLSEGELETCRHWTPGNGPAPWCPLPSAGPREAMITEPPWLVQEFWEWQNLYPLPEGGFWTQDKTPDQKGLCCHEGRLLWLQAPPSRSMLLNTRLLETEAQNPCRAAASRPRSPLLLLQPPWVRGLLHQPEGSLDPSSQTRRRLPQYHASELFKFSTGSVVSCPGSQNLPKCF